MADEEIDGGCAACGRRRWRDTAFCRFCAEDAGLTDDGHGNLRAAGGGDRGPAITPDALRREAQRRGDVYVHHATVRDLMRRLADHMEAMGESAAGGGDRG